MQAVPDPASDVSLKTGLTAIKQENYQGAIAVLEQYLAATIETNTSSTLKAQMGLVVAYSHQNRMGDAIALCHHLNDSQNRKVQGWATRMLTELNPSELNPNELNPNELDTSPSSRNSKNAQMGFIPLEMAEPSPRRSFARSSPHTPHSTTSTHPRLSPVSLEAPLPSLPHTPEPATQPLWRNAGRAQRWQPLSKLNPTRLQQAELGTIAALVLLLCGLCASTSAVQVLWLRFATKYLRWSAFIPSISTPVWLIGFGLVGLFIASTWILDAILKYGYGARSLSTASLAQYSAEAHRLLPRFAQHHHISLPALRLLPTAAPLALTYGSHPKLARIVVSQGLLDQLEDDEIAAIYAGELAHIENWNFMLLSLVAVVTQIPYLLYWQAARLSDWMQHRAEVGTKENRSIALLLKVGATVIAIASTISYGIFRLLRWSGLWLAKARTRYSDRTACNLTGNPNGLARAVLKSAIATTQTIQQQRQTDYLLEGFEVFTPVGYRTALHIGSVSDQNTLKSLLVWDQINPDRHWLALNNSHSLMGERLQQLMKYADYWQLEPELALEPPEPVRKRQYLQGAPVWGIGIGYAIALLLWVLAHLAYRLGYSQLNWFATDYTLFSSFMLMGFGIGTILRFNRFFPDLQSLEKSAQSSSNQTLSDQAWLPLITRPSAVPLDSDPIQLTGTLLGRAGVGNWLGQDLILHTSDRLIPLHYLSQLGAIGNVLPQPTRPQDLIAQSVVITGWFRRGATPWIDVNTIKTQTGRSCRSGHQVWLTILATIAMLFGILLIL